ncbi:MAG: HEPN domain-containing protein [Bacteroidetes bacterium]|nr:HEPN domain-containing protein [Bacteroidota bacterium]MCL6098723.1 HEPN domain-containing protein [Bacteroidota bacterium]
MKENIKVAIEYWVESSKYDLITAEAMLKSKRYLYVGFFCHLSIEKILKAYYWKIVGKEPPFTHNLNLLVEKTNLSELLKDDFQILLDELIPLNIKSRYPDDRRRISKALNNSRCRSLLKRTKEFYRWTEKLLHQ